MFHFLSLVLPLPIHTLMSDTFLHRNSVFTGKFRIVFIFTVFIGNVDYKDTNCYTFTKHSKLIRR